MVRLGWLALAVLLLPASLAQSPTARPFAWIETPAYLAYEGPGTQVVARVHVPPGPWMADAARLFFSLHPHAEALDARLVDVRRADGTPLPLESSSEGNAAKRKATVRIEDVPRDGRPLLLVAELNATHNGRFRLGFLLIAFNDEWDAVPLGDGATAQTYVESTVSVYGIPGRPPFVGRGNVPGFGAAVALFAFGLALRRP